MKIFVYETYEDHGVILAEDKWEAKKIFEKENPDITVVSEPYVGADGDCADILNCGPVGKWVGECFSTDEAPGLLCHFD